MATVTISRIRLPLFAAALLCAIPAFAAPSFGTPGPDAVPTFNSIGLYWAPRGAGENVVAKVRFKPEGSPDSSYREGLDLWFDARNGEYRGSLVELKPGTTYEIRLALASGFGETLKAATWSEHLKVKRTVQVPPGSTRLVIEKADSGDEKEGYVVFTAAPGRNVIDQAGVEGNDRRDSCVVVKQGVHHVIIRGLALKNCRRFGVFIERDARRGDSQTSDIVIEDNDISGWGAFDTHKPGSNLADNDGAIHCDYWSENADDRRPDRIIIQRNALHDPRFGSNPWRKGAGPRQHPMGPQGVVFLKCGRNHVIRYNEIYSKNGNYFMDGIGGEDNFSTAGFPWADSDINGNRISETYDDGIEAEGANRNVRIWGNYLDRVFVAIANAATSIGPLYVWRNVSNRMANMYYVDVPPDVEQRGPFIKGGSNAPANGGRAYYFHNTLLQQPGPGTRWPLGAGWGMDKSGGKLFNFVSRNNIWHIHKEEQINGTPKFAALSADGGAGPIDADYDLYVGPLWNLGRDAERHGWRERPVYASSGRNYPDVEGQFGNFALKPGSPGHQAAQRIANFNDQYPKPDVGAHQSGTPPMRFGLGFSQ